AGERAADLTRQLLAFSRKQTLQPVVMDLNRALTHTEGMLRGLIAENVELILSLDPALQRIKADPAQIDQILFNLAANARDAMPTGGKLTVQTANVHVDDELSQRHPELVPGPYVRLTVSDTGCGMDRMTLSRVFEPFFTTKPVGKGTGLGLATVYGIV